MSIVTGQSDHKLYIPVENELRNRVAYDNTGNILYVVEGGRSKLDVMEFVNKLNHLNFSIESIQEVSYDKLCELYQDSSSDILTARNNTSKQIVVLDVIKEAIKLHASDIHFVITNVRYEIKYRVHGRLIKRNGGGTKEQGSDLIRTLYNTLADNASVHFIEKEKQDARISPDAVEALGIHGGRIATTPTDNGHLVVVRIFYSANDEIPDIRDLGYTESQVRIFEELMRKKYGIVIFSGITGSGKTTSLEKLLRLMISRSEGTKHFYTIEHPPENEIPGAIQSPVLCDDYNDDEALEKAWAKCITNSLRLDPDVIMVGEIRDSGSAKSAFSAGTTGHLVLTTTHAYNPIAILDRFIYDFGLNEHRVLNHKLIVALINQSLVPVVCEHCSHLLSENTDSIDLQFLKRLEHSIPRSKWENIRIKGDGCEHCGHFAIKGRTVVAEIIQPDKGFMLAYLERGSIGAYEYWKKELNGKTKVENLIDLIIDGKVDPQIAELEVGFEQE